MEISNDGIGLLLNAWNFVNYNNRVSSGYSLLFRDYKNVEQSIGIPKGKVAMYDNFLFDKEQYTYIFLEFGGKKKNRKKKLEIKFKESSFSKCLTPIWNVQTDRIPADNFIIVFFHNMVNNYLVLQISSNKGHIFGLFDPSKINLDLYRMNFYSNTFLNINTKQFDFYRKIFYSK